MQGLAGAVCVSVLMGPCHVLEAGGSHNPAAELSCVSLQSLAPLRPPASPACRDAGRRECRRAAPGPGTPDRGTVHSVGQLLRGQETPPWFCHWEEVNQDHLVFSGEDPLQGSPTL